MLFRKIIIVTLAVVLVALSVTPTLALAHHGWSAYGDKPQRVTGVIRDVQFANPHATIALEAEGRRWLVVLTPPSRMSSRGLPAGTLKLGATATVEGYVHRSQDDEMRAEWISLGDAPKQLR